MDKQTLTNDMRYLRGIFAWNDADVIEIREAAKQDPAWWDYWHMLANAFRAADAGIYQPMFEMLV